MAPDKAPYDGYIYVGHRPGSLCKAPIQVDSLYELRATILSTMRSKVRVLHALFLAGTVQIIYSRYSDTVEGGEVEGLLAVTFSKPTVDSSIEYPETYRGRLVHLRTTEDADCNMVVPLRRYAARKSLEVRTHTNAGNRQYALVGLVVQVTSQNVRLCLR